MRWRTFLFPILILLPLAAWTDTPTPSPSNESLPHQLMNGISYHTFGDFFKDWHFVTVRYRKDTGEMRFVYANDIAWKALQKGSVTDYPEGAAFGKVGISTNEDPAFTDSVVPNGAQRYQIMLRQHKKHPETQGWIYAIFLGDHKVHGQGSDADKAAACAACHALVPERGYVFSQPISLGAQAVLAKDIPTPILSDMPANRVAFRTVHVSELSDTVRSRLPSGTAQVRLVQGPVADHVFAGTLDEIRPSLAEEVMRSHMPAALVSKDGVKFSIVSLTADQQPCTPPAVGAKPLLPGRILVAIYTIEPDSAPTPLLARSLTFCQAMP